MLNMELQYPGFWLSMSLLGAGSLSLWMSMSSAKDRDYVGATLALALSASILGLFFI